MKNDQYKAALEEVFTEIDALRLERVPTEVMRLMGGWTSIILNVYARKGLEQTLTFHGGVTVTEPKCLSPYDCEALRERLQTACQARLLTEGQQPR